MKMENVIKMGHYLFVKHIWFTVVYICESYGFGLAVQYEIHVYCTNIIHGTKTVCINTGMSKIVLHLGWKITFKYLNK